MRNLRGLLNTSIKAIYAMYQKQGNNGELVYLKIEGFTVAVRVKEVDAIDFQTGEPSKGLRMHLVYWNSKMQHCFVTVPLIQFKQDNVLNDYAKMTESEINHQQALPA